MESARNIFFIFIQTLCLSEAARKPNILFIVADDLGVGKELDFTRHPDKAHQMEWIRAYLGYRSELNGGSQEDVSERDVEEFYVKCSKFQLVGRLVAGVWGLAQSVTSKIDYDYLHFGLQQLGEYYARKDELLALQLPQ